MLNIANVTTLLRSGDVENVPNCRPISVYPIFSKILERIMYNRIYKHQKKTIACYLINNLGFS